MATEDRKAILITIAVDTSSTRIGDSSVRGVNGGFRGPFWTDGSYEYIPVPETKMRQLNNGKWEWAGNYVEDGEMTYSNTVGYRRNLPLISNIPSEFKENLARSAVHHDPRFTKGGFTYGDGRNEPRGKQLVKLNPGDLLVFCPSLENPESGEKGRFIMGYFTIERVHDFTIENDEFKKNHGLERLEIAEKYRQKNAHFSESYAKAWTWKNQDELIKSYGMGQKEGRDLVLVIGKESESGLLKKAIRITKLEAGSNFVIPTNLVKSLGLKKPIKPLHFDRGWKWVKGPTYLEALVSLLELGEGFI